MRVKSKQGNLPMHFPTPGDTINLLRPRAANAARIKHFALFFL